MRFLTMAQSPAGRGERIAILAGHLLQGRTQVDQADSLLLSGDSLIGEFATAWALAFPQRRLPPIAGFDADYDPAIHGIAEDRRHHLSIRRDLSAWSAAVLHLLDDRLHERLPPQPQRRQAGWHLVQWDGGGWSDVSAQ
jgi:hypothetical protein